MRTNSETCDKRPYVKGKFLYYGDEKFYIKGVTYGTFAPQPNGCQFPAPQDVERDMQIMMRSGINCVRTYTVPPAYLLDIAAGFGLKLMVGLPWEQHIAFLDEPGRKNDIINRLRKDVLGCGQHPAVLCYTIGNEIPAGIVRRYGKKKIEAFLKELYVMVKEADPGSLVTYVNYPTTEYLDLSFLDFDCFNVYLETPEKLGKYIARLHNLCGDRPLVLAEIGLDSLRNGEEKQAETLTWQIETIFGKGCAGAFIFAFTDEWWRGGFEIQDWDFGLTDRERNPKPSLAAVQNAMAAVPFGNNKNMPFISVVVCSYNGSATIRDTLNGLCKLNYPSFEVIVVNDGSTDGLEKIVAEYPVHLISTPNRGLSNARNTGMHNAKGEIIAYIDDDAYPDEHWLHYLAYAYADPSFAAFGGPNIVPEEDGPVAICVANAPGGPVHVLTTDEIAEHIPGCNLTVRKKVLLEIGGFDPIYRAAGDDVDVCWRIQEAGYRIGFHPSALVWHHRRSSLKAYWKQQKGYGKAEALLEAKWPEKYNGFGHLAWAGRLYGNGITLPLKIEKDKVFHGTWGSALFQSVYSPAGSFINSVPLMPEWYLLSGLLAVLGGLGFLWQPLLWAWPLFMISVLPVILQSAFSAAKSPMTQGRKPLGSRYRLLVTILHIIQPIARLYGRFRHGLTPWRERGAGFGSRFVLFSGTVEFTHWSEEWRSNEDWLKQVEQNLFDLKTRVKRGSDFDDWDLQVRNGLFAKSRAQLTIEEHGAGRQYLRFTCRAHYSFYGFLIMGIVSALTIFAVLDNAFVVAGILFGMVSFLLYRFVTETGSCMNSLYTAFSFFNVQQENHKKQESHFVKPKRPRELSMPESIAGSLAGLCAFFTELI